MLCSNLCFNLFNYLFYLFYIVTEVSPPSCPPIFSPTSSLSPISAPTLFLFRKEQAFYGHQQSLGYQVEEGLRSFLCIKAGQGNPIGGMGFQKIEKELDQGPCCGILLLDVLHLFML